MPGRPWMSPRSCRGGLALAWGVPRSTYRAVRRARQVGGGRSYAAAGAAIWWDVRMSFPGDATVSEAGEFPVIERLRHLFQQGEQVLVGPGDDAAVLRIRDGHVL